MVQAIEVLLGLEPRLFELTIGEIRQRGLVPAVEARQEFHAGKSEKDLERDLAAFGNARMTPRLPIDHSKSNQAD